MSLHLHQLTEEALRVVSIRRELMQAVNQQRRHYQILQEAAEAERPASEPISAGRDYYPERRVNEVEGCQEEREGEAAILSADIECQWNGQDNQDEKGCSGGELYQRPQEAHDEDVIGQPTSLKVLC